MDINGLVEDIIVHETSLACAQILREEIDREIIKEIVATAYSNIEPPMNVGLIHVLSDQAYKEYFQNWKHQNNVLIIKEYVNVISDRNSVYLVKSPDMPPPNEEGLIPYCNVHSDCQLNLVQYLREDHFSYWSE